MRIHFELSVEGPRFARPRRRRTLVALAALAIALVLPTVALANHLFSDVPTSHTFHTNISNLAGAGVTAGCGGGKYCPDQPVTRGQMAGFLNRGLGRVAESDVLGDVTGHGAAQIMGSVTISPGTAVPGATQFVRAHFNGTMFFNDVTLCPCSAAIYLRRQVGEVALQTRFTIATASATGAFIPMSSDGVISVTGSTPVTIELMAFLNGGGSLTTSFNIAGNLVAEMIPYGSTGTSAP